MFGSVEGSAAQDSSPQRVFRVCSSVVNTGEGNTEDRKQRGSIHVYGKQPV